MAARRTRAESQAHTRERLIHAAETLFANRGYHQTSVDRIAERAGLTRGAVYANFEGKEGLLFAVAERAGNVMEDAVFADESLDFPQRIRLYARRLISDWSRVRRTILLYSELEVLAMRDPKMRARMAAALEGMYDHRGAALELDAAAHRVPLPLSGPRTLQLTGTAIRGLLRERIIRPKPVDEQFLGDSLLVLFGYQPADHPLPSSQPGSSR